MEKGGRSSRSFRRAALAAVAGVAVAAIIWMSVAWPVFQWRNPIANNMSFFRDFGAVVTLQKLDKYQPHEVGGD